eukprot:508451-Rhodomonas_salina.3
MIRAIWPVQQVLEISGYERSEVDQIVLVGGTTRVPKVREMLQEYFDKEPNWKVDPDQTQQAGLGRRMRAEIAGASCPLFDFAQTPRLRAAGLCVPVSSSDADFSCRGTRPWHGAPPSRSGSRPPKSTRETTISVPFVPAIRGPDIPLSVAARGTDERVWRYQAGILTDAKGIKVAATEYWGSGAKKCDPLARPRSGASTVV